MSVTCSICAQVSHTSTDLASSADDVDPAHALMSSDVVRPVATAPGSLMRKIRQPGTAGIVHDVHITLERRALHGLSA